MGCLSDIKCGNRVIIGIRDYNNCASPESGLFINDIPGITVVNAAKVANEEQQTGYELLRKINSMAATMVFEDFFQRIQFSYNAVVQARQLNYFGSTTQSAAGLEQGLVLKRWRSEVAQILIQEIYVKATVTGTYIVKVIDGDSTTEYSVDGIAGQIVSKRIDKLCESESVKITMDNTSTGVYTGQIYNNDAGCGSCGGGTGFYITGWNGSAEVQQFYGVGALASVRCYEENIICQLLQRMYFLMWYKAGILFFDELLASNRLNPITLYKKELALDKKIELEEKYDTAFKNFAPTITRFINSTKGECFTCNPPIKYANTVSV